MHAWAEQYISRWSVGSLELVRWYTSAHPIQSPDPLGYTKLLPAFSPPQTGMGLRRRLVVSCLDPRRGRLASNLGYVKKKHHTNYMVSRVPRVLLRTRL